MAPFMPLACSEVRPRWTALGRHCRRFVRDVSLAPLLLGLGTCLAFPGAARALGDRGWIQGVFPVVGFAGYTSGFGMRVHPLSGSVRSHDGIDIAAPLGAPVRNWWSGRLVEVIQDGGCGNGLVIRSGDYEHVYCHLGGVVDGPRYSSGPVQLVQGQRLRSGQTIGHVGMTGSTTGPHLHWGLRYRGAWLDPARVLRAMAASRSDPRTSLGRRPNVGLFR
jgi:murein DD-endopeptidase MepM/ murein hydrolase activator NlpD